jgi:hypothetical protein
MKTTILALAVAAAGCNSSSTAAPASAALTDLSTSLDAVRAEFNAHKQEARFLTLLSPS